MPERCTVVGCESKDCGSGAIEQRRHGRSCNSLKEQRERDEQEDRERAERRRLAKEAKRAAYLDYLAERGVKPGPLAWFRLLPDWAQPIVIGLALALAVVTVVVAIAAPK